MCTFPAIYRVLGRKAFTLTELVVVVIIIGILVTIAISHWQAPLEREYEANARAILSALLRAEHNFFAWKGRFTSDWTALAIDDPNNSDTAYNYSLENVTENSLIMRATRRKQGYGLTMDQDGNINTF